MPSVTFPFQHMMRLKVPGMPGGPLLVHVDVPVREDVTVEIRDLSSDDPSLVTVLDATDRSGNHRCVGSKDDGTIYSAVVTGAYSYNGSGGNRTARPFSSFQFQNYMSPAAGSRIIVETPNPSGDDQADASETSGPGRIGPDALGEEDLALFKQARTAFENRVAQAVRIDGEFYLPARSLPVIAIQPTQTGGARIHLVDLNRIPVGEEYSSVRVDHTAMLVPWALASSVRFFDEGFKVDTFDPAVLTQKEHDRDWFLNGSKDALERVVAFKGLHIEHQSADYMRVYAEVVEAMKDGDLEAAWIRLAELRTHGQPKPYQDLVEAGALLAGLPSPEDEARFDHADRLLVELLDEMNDWAEALCGEREGLDAALVEARRMLEHHGSEENVLRTLREMRAEVQDWGDALYGERPSLTKVLVAIDSYLTNRDHEIEPSQSGTARPTSPSPM